MSLWRGFLVLGCLLGFAPAVSAGQSEAAAPKPPPEVARYVQHMAAACEKAGGKPGPSPRLLQHGDLTGDGLADWAIDESGFTCAGAASLFTGNGPGMVVVFAARRKGGARQVFRHDAFGMAMETTPAHGKTRTVTTLWLVVTGPLCGQSHARSNAQKVACDRPLVWNARSQHLAFAPVSRARRPSRIGG